MRPDPRSGLAPGTVPLVLALFSLFLAVAYPRVRQAFLDTRTGAIVSDVEEVVSAARRHAAQGLPWPPGRAPGEMPDEFRGLLTPGFSFGGKGYSLKWDLWERVVQPAPIEAPEIAPSAEETADVPPPEPPDSLAVLQPTVAGLGALTLTHDDDRVLAALLDHFGTGRSFVRDRSWTLILPDSGAGG